jgi:uridine kinase
MTDLVNELVAASREIAGEIHRRLAEQARPIVVALDGGSGAGKSSLASLIADELDIALIPLDDFYSAEIPDPQWDAFSVEERLQHVFDWERLRQQALRPLLAGEPARWHAFDFESGQRPDGTYGMRSDATIRQPSTVILIEGAYSAHPELSAFVDLAILVDVPLQERQARLDAREDEGFLRAWHKRWDPVELYYFACARPARSFDWVVKPTQWAAKDSPKRTGEG